MVSRFRQHMDREEYVILREKTTSRFKKLLDRERRLLIAIAILLLAMSLPFGRFLLYPLTLISTWAHEMCHAVAVKLMGGNIKKIEIYDDGGGICSYNGLCYKSKAIYKIRLAVIASAGYTGTAIVGGVCLLFRRTKKGPRHGVTGIGLVMFLSCLLYVRNVFGFVAILLLSILLVACGLKLPKYIGTLYTLIAAAICLNSITDIHYLFNANDTWIDGEEKTDDATKVAENIGLTYWWWAACWYVQAFAMLALGLLFVKEPEDERFDPDDPDCILPPRGVEMSYPTRSYPVIRGIRDNNADVPLHDAEQFPPTLAATPDTPPPPCNPQLVDELMALGFDRARVIEALHHSDYNVELAAERLFSSGM